MATLGGWDWDPREGRWEQVEEEGEQSGHKGEAGLGAAGVAIPGFWLVGWFASRGRARVGKGIRGERQRRRVGRGPCVRGKWCGVPEGTCALAWPWVPRLLREESLKACRAGLVGWWA